MPPGTQVTGDHGIAIATILSNIVHDLTRHDVARRHPEGPLPAIMAYLQTLYSPSTPSSQLSLVQQLTHLTYNVEDNVDTLYMRANSIYEQIRAGREPMSENMFAIHFMKALPR
eukprot:199340-Chlamydomonas_euryale.AAC.1